MKNKILRIAAAALALFALTGCTSEAAPEKITSVDELNGRLVGVQTGTQY